MPLEQVETAELIQERLALATSHSGVGIWDWDLQTLELVWDESMFKLYRLNSADFSGSVDAWERCLHPEDRSRAEQEVKAALRGAEAFDTEFRVCWSNGEVRYIKAVGKVFRDSNDVPIRMLGSNIDITELRLAEQTLKQSEEQLRFVLEGAELGFWDWNIVTGEVQRNGRWAAMLGYSYAELQNTTMQWTDFIYPDDRERAWDSINAVLEGRAQLHKAEYRMLHKDGGIRWILDQANVMQRDSTGKPMRMCGTHADVTERKLLEEKLTEQAHIDYLTGVANRGYFMELAEQELARSHRYAEDLSVFMLDIDLFKQINDKHGHKVGDAVLKKLAKVCELTLREVDVIGRMGGEEFAVLLPVTDAGRAADVAERLRAAIANAVVILEEGTRVCFTVSIGVNALRSKSVALDELLNAADKALYSAKSAGRNRVCMA